MFARVCRSVIIANFAADAFLVAPAVVASGARVNKQAGGSALHVVGIENRLRFLFKESK